MRKLKMVGVVAILTLSVMPMLVLTAHLFSEGNSVWILLLVGVAALTPFTVVYLVSRRKIGRQEKRLKILAVLTISIGSSIPPVAIQVHLFGKPNSIWVVLLIAAVVFTPFTVVYLVSRNEINGGSNTSETV